MRQVSFESRIVLIKLVMTRKHGIVTFRLLDNCHQLELLDVSYCGQIEDGHVASWRLRYPTVSLKRTSINDGE